MKDETESAIKSLATKAGTAEKACDAQQFAQAALNLAHILATLDNLKPASK